MTNEELITALRWCQTNGCRKCVALLDNGSCKYGGAIKIFHAAADALEAADKRIARLEEELKTREAEREVMQDTNKVLEKRIAELEDDLRNSTISNPERFKISDYTVRDLILFADMCKRNDVKEADLKQAAWNLELAVRAVMNERQEIVKNTMDEITMRFTPDFEKAFEEMMPKCGARMNHKYCDVVNGCVMCDVELCDGKEKK